MTTPRSSATLGDRDDYGPLSPQWYTNHWRPADQTKPLGEHKALTTLGELKFDIIQANFRGNVSDTARRLGMHRRTVQRIIQRAELAGVYLYNLGGQIDLDPKP
jgi:hypothetical protein